MPLTHPHAGATYRVVTRDDATYGIEVLIPGTHPTMITGFATQRAAKAWVATHKRQIALGAVPRGKWRLSRERDLSRRDASRIPI